ncbi:MAG: SPOR domain-containing protein, partial [Gammaproteobacteria bacterium]
PKPIEPLPPRPPEKAILPKPELQAWVVQLGTFRRRENALGLRDRLQKQGYPSFIETAEGRRGPLYRVRVGPFLEKEEAQAVLGRLEQALHLKGLVLPHR